VAALVLLVGYNVTPASAHVVPPYQWVADYNPGTYCAVADRYGTYGNGFAEMYFGNWNANCHPYTAVKVTTLDANGIIHVSTCSFLEAAYDPNWTCVPIVSATGLPGIRAVATGTAWAIDGWLVPVGGGPTAYFSHTAI
jgi:hypothetical protein